MAFLSYELAQINSDAPIRVKAKDAIKKILIRKSWVLFRENGFPNNVRAF